MLQIRYLPPPAQAQAQPAQAHAHECPPPPPPPLRVVVTTGGGLVVPVTFSVKLVTLPRTLFENPCTPPTTEAAKSAPGKALTPPPAEVNDLPEVDGMDVRPE